MSPARLIASGFGVGHAPAAQGTIGSLLALLAGAALMPVSGALAAAALLATFGGVLAIRAARVEGDPGWVVIDEIAGQWIAMLGLARLTWTGLLAAFVLFRVLDITKPGPIGWADRQEGAVGIMLDDVIAGIVAAIVLYWMGREWPGRFG